jgi:hypothetical protein
MAKVVAKKSKVILKNKSEKKNKIKVTKTPIKNKILTKKSPLHIKKTISIPPILNFVDTSVVQVTFEKRNQMIAEAAYYISERYRANPQLAAWQDAEKEIERMLLLK